uniref:Uncharacterized protein n=1 Tax=Oryza sativa subsp. japonica TaxID=39947 RepID=Q6Z383_ORYSJ|nr:hypothetical protein [Oryza sativa Japonica Group]
MNGLRTQSRHDELGQNSQVCSEQQKRRPPAKIGLDWAVPWFGRTAPCRRWMQGWRWTVWIASLWRLEGITDLSNRHNRHYLPIEEAHLPTSPTHLKQELSHILSS